MTENKKVWNDILPTVETPTFGEWLAMENLFGEFGEPGLTQSVRPVISLSFFGHLDSVDVKFTIYRGADGELLCVHGKYVDEENLVRPFILMVHPDHQGQGIGTMVVEFLLKEHEEERGYRYTWEETYSKQNRVTPAGATFINKWANSVYEKENKDLGTEQ
jgi:GNAT superfamily N-acetyltransferase